MRYKFINAIFILTASIVFAIWPDTLLAREACLYVDSTGGSDANAGTAVKPLMTLDRAAVLANQNKREASVTIRDGIAGKRNAMTYCIIYGGYISGPWTCQTSEDFEFHHNVIANCRFAWMRKPGDYQRYSMKNCVVVNCESFSGCGGPFGPFQRTGKDVTFKKDKVIETGQIMLEQNRYNHKYLQLTQGSLGSDLGAGLFKKQ